MHHRMRAYLKLLRFVNVPTVPGDVLVGAALASLSLGFVASAPLVFAALASCALYLYALVDNDIVGAATDSTRRPIPAGEISCSSARIVRLLMLLLALAFGWLGALPPAWWALAFVLFAMALLYNRRRNALLMGLCRGLNVLLGGALFLDGRAGADVRTLVPLFCVALLWTLYIAFVTRYSKNEDTDPARRAVTGQLIGALVYGQLLTLLAVYLVSPTIFSRNLLLAGAILLVVLRLTKRLLPKVSAS